MKFWPLLILLFLPSCASFVKKDHGFRETSSVELNGAKVRSGLKPMGGKQYVGLSAMVVGGAVGTTDGPFLWRIEAEGKAGVHEWLRVNKVRVTTHKTKRDEWYPQDNLGINAPFRTLPGKKGKSFAKYQLPGRLTVMPETDGRVRILANVSVKAAGRTETGWLKFELDPETKWNTESVFIPTELVKSFRKDPREWKWQGSDW